MRQSTIIFGSLLLAFVIYITLRGQLPSYLGLFTGKGSSSTANTNNSGSTETTDKSTTDKATGFAKSLSTLTDTLSSMGLV